MFKRALIYLSLLAVLVTSCAAAALPSQPAAEAPYMAGDLYAGEAQRAVQSVFEGEASTGGAYAQALPDAKRIVIKNADLSIIVDDPSESVNRISQMAEQMGGYVVSARVYQQRVESGTEVLQASISIRVPAERLNEAMERIKGESDRPVVHENIDSQDVTSEYTDLQSRVRNLEAAEAQLQEIMLSAKKTEDVLSVYQQLTQVREQIEVTKGKIQYYDQASALSSISVQLVPNAAIQPLTIAGWEPKGVAKNAIQSLISGLQRVAEFGIWATLYAIPMMVVYLAPVAVFLLIVRRLLNRNKTKAIPPSPTA